MELITLGCLKETRIEIDVNLDGLVRGDIQFNLEHHQSYRVVSNEP